MEMQAAKFYDKAAAQTLDVSVRELLTRLADIERGHEKKAGELAETHLAGDAKAEEDATKRRMFVLQVRAAGPRGPDGRLGLDAGAPVRRRFRHA